MEDLICDKEGCDSEPVVEVVFLKANLFVCSCKDHIDDMNTLIKMYVEEAYGAS